MIAQNGGHAHDKCRQIYAVIAALLAATHRVMPVPAVGRSLTSVQLDAVIEQRAGLPLDPKALKRFVANSRPIISAGRKHRVIRLRALDARPCSRSRPVRRCRTLQRRAEQGQTSD